MTQINDAKLHAKTYTTAQVSNIKEKIGNINPSHTEAGMLTPYMPVIIKLVRAMQQKASYYARFVQKAKPLAYASELGELTARGVSTKALIASYGLSIAYVGVDTMIAYNNAPEEEKYKILTEKIVFHSFASLLLPSVVIHRTMHAIQKNMVKPDNMVVLKKYLKPTVIVRLPMILAFVALPFIVIPIDHGVEYIVEFGAKVYDQYKVHDI
jgi:hypothetical protein